MFIVDFLVGLVCDLRLIIIGWRPVWFGLVFVCIGCVCCSCDYGVGGSLFREFGFMLGSCVLFAVLCEFCACGFSCLVNLVCVCVSGFGWCCYFVVICADLHCCRVGAYV